MSRAAQKTFPLISLRDLVVYPYMVVPLFVGRKPSIEAIEAASRNDKRIFLVAQKDSALEVPKQEDLYEMGVVANILQLLRLPDGTMKMLVQGL